MSTTVRTRLVTPVLLGVALVAAACGGDGPGGGGYEVTSEVVSHETIQDLLVFAPDSDGSWPAVWAMHGIDGEGGDMAELATRLAREGFVVFAPTFRTDLSTQQGTLDAVRDAECSYRFGRSVAAEHGGDLDRPITFVGWSLGAGFALQGGLIEEIDPSGEFVTCFAEVPRADLIVATSGCYYEFEGARFDFDASGWGSSDADVIVLAGDEDAACPAWQSEDAVAELRASGYDVEFELLDGADHFAPIFHDLVDGELVVSPDEPTGARIVQLIVDTIAAD